MPISPELQAKIDALLDQDLKRRVIDTLSIPRDQRPGDEEAFEFCLNVHEFLRESETQRAVNARRWQESASPELQARINALPDEKLRANILDVLHSPGRKLATDEEIFDLMVNTHTKVMAQRARLRKWRDDEVLAFAEYFKQQMPKEYVEFLRQEREDHQIDGDLGWEVRLLAERWCSGLDVYDYDELFGHFRDHVQANLI